MARPAKPVELPDCTCADHTCEIHGVHRRRTFQRVNRWARQGKISPEAHAYWLGKWKDDPARVWRNLNDAVSR